MLSAATPSAFDLQPCNPDHQCVRERTTGGKVATTRKTMTLPEDVADRLTEQARIEDRPMARIVAAALREYFESHARARA
jgi:hypothetical protein